MRLTDRILIIGPKTINEITELNGNLPTYPSATNASTVEQIVIIKANIIMAMVARIGVLAMEATEFLDSVVTNAATAAPTTNAPIAFIVSVLNIREI